MLLQMYTSHYISYDQLTRLVTLLDRTCHCKNCLIIVAIILGLIALHSDYWNINENCTLCYYV